MSQNSELADNANTFNDHAARLAEVAFDQGINNPFIINYVLGETSVSQSTGSASEDYVRVLSNPRLPRKDGHAHAIPTDRDLEILNNSPREFTKPSPRSAETLKMIGDSLAAREASQRRIDAARGLTQAEVAARAMRRAEQAAERSRYRRTA